MLQQSQIRLCFLYYSRRNATLVRKNLTKNFELFTKQTPKNLMKICKPTAELRSYKHWSRKTSFTTNLPLIFLANITIIKNFVRINEYYLFKSLKEINYRVTAMLHGKKWWNQQHFLADHLIFCYVTRATFFFHVQHSKYIFPRFLCLLTAVIL